jgi:hypothetical protein
MKTTIPRDLQASGGHISRKCYQPLLAPQQSPSCNYLQCKDLLC